MQTQSQSQRSQSSAFKDWYVVTNSASALRMTGKLTIGESDSGALALNDPEAANQWVELVLAGNGEPWATIVTRDKSLRVGGTTCLRRPLRAGDAIKLPNSTLYVSHDIRKPRPSGTVVEIVHRDIPELLPDLVGPGLEEALINVREPHPGMHAADPSEGFDPTLLPPRQAEARTELGAGTGDDWSDHDPVMAEPRRTKSAARQRQVAVVTGVLALGAVTLAGAVAVLVSMDEREGARVGNFEPTPLSAPPASSPTEKPAETPGAAGSSADASPTMADPARANLADGASDAPAPSVEPSPLEPSDSAISADASADRAAREAAEPAPAEATETAHSADSDAPPVADATAPSELAVPTDRAPEQVATLPRAEPETPAPAEVPPAERPQASQPAGAAETITDPQTIDTEPEPDPAVVAELEDIGESARALAAELALRRDLRAAALALAQGRLTSPPEASAYTLYNRVLALDPGSPEAMSGLQSVRQGLINRALAQLAGNRLDDARRSLQAAADAGADPQLVADLRGEVEYRHQQNDVTR